MATAGTISLREVKAPEQFSDYYSQNNLHSTEDRISKLREEMKITAIRGEGASTPDDTLSLLEEAALLGYWRASW